MDIILLMTLICITFNDINTETLRIICSHISHQSVLIQSPSISVHPVSFNLFSFHPVPLNLCSSNPLESLFIQSSLIFVHPVIFNLSSASHLQPLFIESPSVSELINDSNPLNLISSSLYNIHLPSVPPFQILSDVLVG